MHFSNIMIFNSRDVVEGYRLSFGCGTARLGFFLLANFFKVYLLLMRAVGGR